MLVALKIVPVTYPMYQEIAGPETLPAAEVNNAYILKDTDRRLWWEYVNPEDFEMNYRWVEPASTTTFKPVERINENMDLL